MSNKELRDDILRRHVTAQFSDLPVARGSAVAEHFNDMMMVGVWQSRSVLRLAGHRNIFHRNSV